MSERITIEKAVQMTGFPAEDIRDWAKSKKIKSYSYRDGEPLIDAASLQNFVSGVKRQGMQKLYLPIINPCTSGGSPAALQAAY